MTKFNEVTIEENETESVSATFQSANVNLLVLEEMLKAGLFIGRKSSKTHPKIKPYLTGVKNNIAIIDLEEAFQMLEKAVAFLKGQAAKKNTSILFAGTTPAAKSLVKETAERLQSPFVIERWLGGTLTNFKTLSKRIAYFKKLKSDKESGRLEKYTKKERLGFDRQIAKLSIMFSGLEMMPDLPGALVVVDVNAHSTAIREATRLKIPVVGILNTDTNPELVAYPILANDRSRAGIGWLLGRLEKAIEDGRTATPIP